MNQATWRLKMTLLFVISTLQYVTPYYVLFMCVFAFRPRQTGWMWTSQTATVWQLWCSLSGTLNCLRALQHLCHGTTVLWRWLRSCLDSQRKKNIHFYTHWHVGYIHTSSRCQLVFGFSLSKAPAAWHWNIPLLLRAPKRFEVSLALSKTCLFRLMHGQIPTVFQREGKN